MEANTGDKKETKLEHSMKVRADGDKTTNRSRTYLCFHYTGLIWFQVLLRMHSSALGDEAAEVGCLRCRVVDEVEGLKPEATGEIECLSSLLGDGRQPTEVVNGQTVKIEKGETISGYLRDT